MQVSSDGYIPVIETNDGLDQVNEQLLRATWEVDFHAKAAAIAEALTTLAEGNRAAG